jgi:hypothetical protein
MSALIMEWLSGLITYGGAVLCMFVPVFLLGVVFVWVAPRVSGFLDNSQNGR